MLRAAPALVLLAVTGCAAVGPEYRRPEPRTDLASWAQTPEAGLVASETDVSRWWQTLGDPLLSRLVETATAQNLDLDQARSRVREARAQRGVTAAAGLPSATASGSAVRQRQGTAEPGSLFATGFDAAWELDLFGRVKRSTEAAGADLGAAVESLRDVQVSLLAEVALNYVEVRAAQSRLGLTRANVASQQETRDLVATRYELGLANELELSQADANLANTRSQLASIEADLARARNRVAVLLGQKPGTLDASLAEPAPVPSAPAEVAVGIPADLLRRRADVRKAERELAAQTARVGVALADLYPRFRLSGALSFQATDASNLFTALARVVSAGPSFQWNVFSAGSVRSNIEVQNERQQQALLGYEKSVLTALEDVENAMMAYARELDRREALREASGAARKAAELAESLYRDGLRDFLTVLDAQRSLFAQEDALAQSDARVTSNLIRLYKALGGGWTATAGEREAGVPRKTRRDDR